MADVLVKPAFQSAVADSGDATKLGPAAWNAARLFSGGSDGDVVARDSASPTGASWVVPTVVTAASLGLGNVENVALSTWAGSANLVTLGALTSLKIGTGANLTSPGDGRLVLTNNAITKRVMFETTLDAKLRLLNFDGTLFTDLECGALTLQGNAVFNGTTTFNSNIVEAAAGAILWSGRGTMRSPANAQINFINAAESAGVGIDVATDAIFKVRTRAQTGYATLDCLGLKASGVAGASGTFTSVTVVNGIVTAGT